MGEWGEGERGGLSWTRSTTGKRSVVVCWAALGLAGGLENEPFSYEGKLGVDAFLRVVLSCPVPSCPVLPCSIMGWAGLGWAALGGLIATVLVGSLGVDVFLRIVWDGGAVTVLASTAAGTH